MDKITQEASVSKLCVMADNVVLQNRELRSALPSSIRKKPEYCKLDKSIQQLQETTEKCRKTGAAGEP